MKVRIIIAFLFAVVVMSFNSQDVLRLVYPDYFPKPVYDESKNPLTTQKVALGRLLFYDSILSNDNSISCASCHSPYNAFAHTDHDLSHGIHDSIGTRNAPALFNLAWQSSFMWDGAINHIDMQALAPLSHPGEMGEDIENVIRKLNDSAFYKAAFFNAWRDSTATGERFLKSLAQFQLTLISADSKYDKVQSGQENFTDQEKKGYFVFNEKCNSCHTEPLFSSYEFANNGLPLDSTLKDLGKYDVSMNPKDSMMFKIPSLRNLSYTYPYMHDGRFLKLSEVLNHYNDLTEETSPELELKKPLDMSSRDKADLIAFLLTLDDETFVFDPKTKFPRELLNK